MACKLSRKECELKVFVSTHPFGVTSDLPLKLLKENKIEYVLNQYGRKITSEELAKSIGNADILIAGTEKITEEVFKNAPNLKLIARVGIGLDGIDFELCKKYNVKVTYTPDAPTIAVAELTVGLIIDLARKVTVTNNLMRSYKWKRHMGMLLYGKTIGILGLGRIGKSLVHMLSTFNVKFKAHDINPDIAFGRLYNIDFVSKEEVLKESDVVTIHVPLKDDTKNYITLKELELMKENAFLINTARGGIVNESDLYEAIKRNIIAGAAIDVFEEEPYKGNLLKLENIITTCHMGASTIESRTKMEIEATEEVIRFKNGLPLKNEVFVNG